MPTIQTIFGTIDDKQLKEFKGAVEEIIVCMNKISDEKDLMGEIIDQIHKNTNIPKKIIKKIVKVYHKQSFQEESAEYQEFEAIYESINEVK